MIRDYNLSLGKYKARYFTEKETQCKCGCKGNVQDILLVKMDYLRYSCGFPLIVSSGYRCPEHNARVSGTGLTGPHTTGLAVDFKIHRERAFHLLNKAYKLDFTGIGVKQTGNSRFIHLDILTEKQGFPRPTIWSY